MTLAIACLTFHRLASALTRTIEEPAAMDLNKNFSKHSNGNKALGSRHAAWQHLPACDPGWCQVVEIAPAFGLDEGMRQQLHNDAVRLVKHVGYRNAGAHVARQLVLAFS